MVDGMAVIMLWVEGTEPDINKGVQAVRDALDIETDREKINWAAAYAGCPDLDELTWAVIDADPHARASFLDKIADGYRTALTYFIKTLTAADVARINVGPLTCYVTGGMSYGEDPTYSFSEWRGFFETRDDTLYDNPYGAEIHNAMFVRFDPNNASPGTKSRVASVALTTTTSP